ncbi:transglutaminase-like domain-containing protein [Paracoccus aestuariivivens]|uniref:Transglutaminase n=1 Tax=Paracoccus aestuariivivens TaxID=1820333 RepID=A0A6L6J971_9RHOB|nr:transglutaminase domain-containing protein [Paracoccus aestuariivivens]MTH76674.1 transglutaminase [Paracoccus aestuariivivens]
MISRSRRNVLKLALLAGAAPMVGGFARQAFAADRPYAPAATDWRKFETRTVVTLPDGQGPAQVWLPVPSVESDYQRGLQNSWTGNATAAELVTDEATGAKFLRATFENGGAPHIELVSSFETRNRTIDWLRKSDVSEDPMVLEAALKPSTYKPLDGVVAETAKKITAGAATDVDKVKAIYAWIVSNCHRNMDVPGCGPGDNVATLTTAGLGGKCADLNGLFVGLARASGVPARDVFGVRVAPSAFGYKQLGANNAVITGAQHCRAEVWLSGYGWVAMDPADVLKVMRAESETWIKDPSDPLVAQVNNALFGNWEGNWVAYNTAEDLALPGRASTLPFLMYPQATIGGKDVNELDAKAFTYEITSTEV